MSKFAVSNIAWDRYDDPAVFVLLHKYGFTGIEIAPGKVWGGVANATPTKVADYRRQMAAEGLETPAMQAILFGHPDLQVFDASTHDAFREHMKRLGAIAEGVGAKVLVFGAPKNRRRFGLSFHDADALAADFFRSVAPIMVDHGCELGLEANPVDYQCDFLTNTADLANFVRAVDAPGICMHFDSGATLMNRENLAESINAYPVFKHYHVSEPMLAPVGTGTVDMEAGFKALQSIGYTGWKSIEMKMQEPVLENLEAALKLVAETEAKVS